jgi:hypothetical protein
VAILRVSLIQSVPNADSRIRGEALMADTPASVVSAGATATTSRADIDAGLRQFLLRVYNCMASGLALTGAVAYVAAESGFTPLWQRRRSSFGASYWRRWRWFYF